MPAAPNFYIRDIPVYGDVILAPMSGYSDQPYRALCRSLGSALSYTEFVTAAGICYDVTKFDLRLAYTPAERPIVYQIFDFDEDRLARAAEIIAPRQPDIIDLNMGCSVDDVALHGAGAGLLRTPEKIYRIIKRLAATVPMPVTGKIRLGWNTDSLNYLEVLDALQQAGASLVAVHGRTRAQLYRGEANWDAIAEIKRAARIPVIGNGDVKSPADIARMKAHTGVDAVMIGRAAIGNPWIFQRREREDVPFEEVAATVQQHLSACLQFYGVEEGARVFKRHVIKYVLGRPGARPLRGLISDTRTADDLIALINHYFVLDAVGDFAAISPVN